MMNSQKLAALSLSSPESSPDNSLVLAHILSLTPGRIRIRVVLSPQQTKQLNLMILGLKNQLALEKVRINLYGGSITLFYNPKLVNHREIIEKLRGFGLRFCENSSKSLNVVPKYSKAAVTVNQVTKNLNQCLRQASNNIVDLGVLIPLSFGLLAWRQLILKGWQLETIPWYVLAWYGFDSFIKLQRIDEGSGDLSQQD